MFSVWSLRFVHDGLELLTLRSDYMGVSENRGP